ncbi:hypothetical protein ACXPWS_00585 [Mycobacterium sp. BMJ-28]
MRPIVGWRSSLATLGVISAANDSLSRNIFATNISPFDSSPLVGNLGDNAYFMAGDPASVSPKWWLVGIDVRDGRRLFPAVQLTESERPPQCYLNGLDALLCVANDTDNVTAWTIDAHNGAVIYTGPTDLRTFTGKLGTHQVGIYAVAATESSGVYGVGPHAETTWFVPGNGDIDQAYPGTRDFQSQTLATQGSGQSADSRVVFSVKDGAVLKPRIDDGGTLTGTAIYPGGFAAEIANRNDSSTVQFFDEAGARVGEEVPGGTLGEGTLNLPIVKLKQDEWAAYSVQGRKLIQQSTSAPSQTRLIGTTLFAMGDSGWHQYDLESGSEGKRCNYGLGEGGYIANAGNVVVLSSGNATVGLETTGADLASCDTLWTLSSAAGSFRHVWRINTTLVQISDDGTELMSLVAPG